MRFSLRTLLNILTKIASVAGILAISTEGTIITGAGLARMAQNPAK